MLKSSNSTYGRAGTAIRSLPFILAVALLALLWAAGPVEAHGGWLQRADKIFPVLAEEQPEELEGVTIKEVEQNEANPFLVVENQTGETLELYDSKGEPFLRLGPEGAEGNKFAEEFYATRLGGEVPQEVLDSPDAEPEWEQINDEPLWGWFDRRMRTESIEVPEDISRARDPADLGEWSIPVRLGETETEVRGVYRYVPPPKGEYAARLTSELESSDVSVQLLHGSGQTGADLLFLQNSGEDPVTILGRSGDPAIRIGPQGTQINVNSPLGREVLLRGDSDASAEGASSGATEKEAPPETAEPEWRQVSGGSIFEWLDPRIRLSVEQSQPPEDAEASDGQEVARWEIPMEIAGEEQQLTGVTEWHFSEWVPPPATTEEEEDGIGFREVAIVGAVTVVPAVAMLALLLGPGLYKRYRYHR